MRIAVRGNNMRDWEAAIKKNTSENTQMIICAIPGNRGKGPLYKELKKTLLVNYPIPSQVILVGTITKRKMFINI